MGFVLPSHWKLLRLLTRWVGGLEKGQKHAYVIFEWSLMRVPGVVTFNIKN